MENSFASILQQRGSLTLILEKSKKGGVHLTVTGKWPDSAPKKN